MWHPFASLSQNHTSRSRPFRHRRAMRPRLEGLEGRVVLSVAFDSVLGVGGDTASITAWDNAVDSAGNSYVTGVLYGTTDLDPAVDRPDGSDILTARGTSDTFLAKYAPDNTLVWARQMGSDLDTSSLWTNEGGHAVEIDRTGNVYVSGGFLGQADFGPFRLTSAGDKDVFVAKLDASGNVLWAKGWGGTTRDMVSDLAIDSAGNAVSVGGTAIVSGDGGSWTMNGTEVHRFSATGAATWTASFDTASANDVATDANGNVYVAGGFRGTVDFNPNPRKTSYLTGASTGGNGFVLKLTSAGVFSWAVPFVAKTSADPNSFAGCSEIEVDAGGNVLVGGQYSGQVDFNPSSKQEYRLASTGGAYVAKLSSAGAFAWATPLGGVSLLGSLTSDESGAVYAVGTFTTVFTPGFGLPTATNVGGSDVFVVKLASTGVVSWAATFGGTGAAHSMGIAVDQFGTVYVAGWYNGTVDFDPDPLTTHEKTNTAYADMYLLKLRQQ